MQTEKQPEYVIEHWAYAGKRETINKDHKRIVIDVFYPLVDGEITEKHHAYDADKRMKTIGGIYSIKTLDNGARAVVGSAQFQGMIHDAKKIAEWRLESDACRNTIMLRRMEAKGKTDAFKCLEPLRRAYHSAPFDQRDAMELLILRYIRRHGKGE